MPEIEFCTAARPLSAAASERCATRAPSSAVDDTSEIERETCNTCAVVSSISFDWRSAAPSSSAEIDCACAVFCVTWMAALFTPVDQGPQLVDRVVHRVGDGARDVLGHLRADGEVAVGEVAHLVQQPQDRFLVALVLRLGLGGAAARVGEEHQRHQHQHEQNSSAASTAIASSVRSGLLGLQRVPAAAAPRTAAARCPTLSCAPAWRADTSFCSSRRIGPTFCSNVGELLLQLGELGARLRVAHRARCPAPRCRLSSAWMSSRMSLVSLPMRNGTSGSITSEPRISRRAAPEALGEEGEAVGAQHLARAASPTAT